MSERKTCAVCGVRPVAAIPKGNILTCWSCYWRGRPEKYEEKKAYNRARRKAARA